jgi:hypothetical protein
MSAQDEPEHASPPRTKKARGPDSDSPAAASSNQERKDVQTSTASAGPASLWADDISPSEPESRRPGSKLNNIQTSRPSAGPSSLWDDDSSSADAEHEPGQIGSPRQTFF